MILGDNITETSQTIYMNGQGYPLDHAPWSFYTPPGAITLEGPGSVISEAGVDFQPKTSNTEFRSFMSTKGQVWLKPAGNFIGSIAGQTIVDLQPSTSVTFQTPPPYLNVPRGSSSEQTNVVQQIVSWTPNLHMPVIVTGSLPPGQQGIAYSGQLVAAGGTEPYTWSQISGSLPTGVNLSSSGFVTGTPTSLGTYHFTVNMNDSAGGSDQATISMEVFPALGSITSAPTPLPGGEVGMVYPGATMSVSGGTAPYSWTWFGDVPPGLTLSPSGSIGGTPTAAGTFSPNVRCH